MLDSNDKTFALEENSNQESMAVNVQCLGNIETLPEGHKVRVTFDVGGTATPGTDFEVKAESPHFVVSEPVWLSDNEMAVTLEAHGGKQMFATGEEGLFSLKIASTTDKNVAQEDITFDIKNVEALNGEGEPVGDKYAWDDNDLANFVVASPVVTHEATIQKDDWTSEDMNKAGADVFKWDLGDLANRTDTVHEFNSGDQLDLSDVLSQTGHSVIFDVQVSGADTLVKVEDTTSKNVNGEPTEVTITQEIVLDHYQPDDVAEMIAQLSATGKYTAG